MCEQQSGLAHAFFALVAGVLPFAADVLRDKVCDRDSDVKAGCAHSPLHGDVLHDCQLPRGGGGGDLLLDALVDLRAELLPRVRDS